MITSKNISKRQLLKRPALKESKNSSEALPYKSAISEKKKAPSLEPFQFNWLIANSFFSEASEIQIKPHLTHSNERQEVPFDIAVEPGFFQSLLRLHAISNKDRSSGRGLPLNAFGIAELQTALGKQNSAGFFMVEDKSMHPLRIRAGEDQGDVIPMGGRLF